MALNPYTLNHLYEKGILDYVPTELMMGTPVGTMTPMNNPYLDMAKQGGLYQSHGASTDSFHSDYTPAYTPQYTQNVSSGSNYGAYSNSNMYNGNYKQQNTVMLGSRSNAGGMNSFNGYGIGSNNQNTIGAAFGENGTIGSQSNTGGINTFGGFADTQNNITSGFNKAVTVIDRTPKLLLGLAAGAIGLIGIASLFKRGKKPPKTTNPHTSFWSKLNPMNWRKHK